MKRAKQVWLLSRALYMLARYDAVLWLHGFGPILQELKQQGVAAKTTTPKLEQNICDAVLLATCIHWKPVLCLQRSVGTVRLLRKRGLDARLVTG